MFSTATQPTQIPFKSIRKKLREAIEQYKQNHPEKTDEYREFKKFFDAFASKKTFDTQNIDELLYKQYPRYQGEYKYITLLKLAVLLDSAELVQDMLEHGASLHTENRFPQDPPLHYVIDRGNTALHYAANIGNVEIVKLLIKWGANPNEKSYTDRTPLHFAAHQGHTDIVRLLLENGAYPNEKEFKDNTPLHYAALYRYTAIVELLLRSGADVNTKNGLDQTPLHQATATGCAKIVKLLFRSGADVNAEDWAKSTPLHTAIINGKVEIVEMLVQYGADVNAVSTLFATPLHQAAGYGRAAIVELLLRSGADVNAKDQHDETPLHHAIRRGDLVTLEILAKYGAEVNPKDWLELNGPWTIGPFTTYNKLAEYLLSLKDEKLIQASNADKGHEEAKSDSVDDNNSNTKIAECFSSPSSEEVEQIGLSGKVDQEGSDN